MPTQIKARNDTAVRWSSFNPILAKGELGLETDTNLFKFGDGVRAWGSLPYAGGSGGGTVPADVLRLSTPGVVVHQADNALVGSDFVAPGYYQRTATGWTFPYWLQQQSYERFAVTSFPYTLTQADAELGMILLQPAGNATVVLPAGLNTAAPVLTSIRTYLDTVFYIEGAVAVTFTPGSGANLMVPGTTAPAANYAVNGPRRTVVMQVRPTSFRVLD